MTTQPTQPARSDQKTWQVLAHLSALVWVIGVPGVAGPLVVWLLHREDEAIEPHAREALNFHISMVLYGFGAGALAIVLLVSVIGILLLPAVGLFALILAVVSVVFSIIGGIRASNNELYRYPLNLRLIS